MFLGDKLYQISQQIDLSKPATFNKAIIEIFRVIIDRILEADVNNFTSEARRVNNSYKLFVKKMQKEGKYWFKESGLVDYLNKDKETKDLAKILE